MKLTIQLVLVMCLLQISCGNDDANNTQNTTTNLIGARISFSSFSDIVTLDLETGNSIASLDDKLFANVTYQNSFIGILENRIVRSTSPDFTEDIMWEIAPTEGTNLELNLINSQLVLNNNIVYVSLSVTNPDIAETFYNIIAINADTGEPIWNKNQLEVGFRQITILNDRIITLDGIQGDAIISSRNIENGDIIDQWHVGERVSHLVTGQNEIIVMSWNNTVYSIDENLSVNWAFTTEGANVRKGVITGNQFLFHSRDENIYALNLQFGTVNWSQNMQNLLIISFFGDSNTIWSVTRNFDDNTLITNEIDVNNGTIFSTFSVPIATTSINDLELVYFDDYLFVITTQLSGNAITQLVNFISQEVVWQNEISLTNISIFKANILLNESRFTRSSF